MAETALSVVQMPHKILALRGAHRVLTITSRERYTEHCIHVPHECSSDVCSTNVRFQEASF